jgi:hypothetical protein
VRAAVLEADRAGLKRRFVSSTLARVSPAYYRSEAIGTVRPPHSADFERMLSIAYDIRSGRSHVLEDLGDEAWVFTDGAETVFGPRFRRILTLAGLWRLVRHVVRRFVADAPKTEPEPWDYRNALPGIIQVQLAPQYWIWQPDGVNAKTAQVRFNGVAEALISWLAGDNDEGFDLTQVLEQIESLTPNMPDGDAKTALVAIYFLWHEWTDPRDHRPDAKAFLDAYQACLDAPSPTAFTVGLLSNRKPAGWTPDEWAELATAQRAARVRGKEAPLPEAVDALLQLETADQLEAAGRHDEAVMFAANAVEERPGHHELLTWEERLLAGDHDPNFNCHEFLFGKKSRAEVTQGEVTIGVDETAADADPQQSDPGRLTVAGPRVAGGHSGRNAAPHSGAVVDSNPVAARSAVAQAQLHNFLTCANARAAKRWSSGFWPVSAHTVQIQQALTVAFPQVRGLFSVTGAGFEPATSGQDRPLRVDSDRRGSPRVIEEKPR